MTRRVLALAFAALAALAAPASAQIVRSFTPRFSTNDNGDIAIIGNTLMSCSGGGTCTNGRNGTGGSLNNNDFNMQNVDVDGVGGTFNSSSATLTLPAGATVLWAGLYWSGNSNHAQRNTCAFDTPTAGYVTITATQLDAIGSVYQGYADVTARVQAGGNGAYWVGSVRTTTGTNQFAGWGLVVVYRLATDPPRNLVVWDGYGEVAPGATQTINVSGFLTPPAGAVNTRLGVISGEGDLGYTGDAFRLNGAPLTDAVNPAANFFNSTVSRAGAHVTTKTPNYQNQLGWDVDLFAAAGILPNGATAATITLTSTDDRYYPGVVTFSTELYQPILTGNSFTKTVTDVNGGATYPGETLDYLLTLSNSGNDAASGTVLRDTIPANAVYVPGSLVVVNGPNAGAKTDAAGDDQAEYDAATRRVIVRLGTGANAVAGGRLAPAAATSVRFRVTVAANAANGSVVSNQAVANFVGEQTGTPFVTQSDGNTVAVGIQRTDVTVTVATVLSGWAYDDADHNAQHGVTEGGTSNPLWVKLVAASAPAVAIAVSAVDPVGGSWTLGGVAPGNYFVVLDNNALLTDVTPASPAGWIGTENPGGSIAVAVASTSVTGLGFGFWHGSTVAGRVFRDDGVVGVANDGVAQAGEAGVAGVRVRAASAACGVCDSALTSAAGAFVLWVPHAASGSPVRVAETNASGWISTGGGAGTTGGSYARGADEVTFTPLSGVAYSGVAFGDVPPSTWAAGGAQSVVPGQAAFYGHVFVAGSSGAVAFGVAQLPNPVVPGWTVTLIRDLDCDGVVDAGEPAIAAPVALAAGQSVCVVVRHDSPAGAAVGASEQVTVSAAFTYGGAAPPLVVSSSLVDLTTLGATGGLQLVKTADRATARPGDVITYTITYTNPGPEPLSSIAIHDATPGFTVFDAGSCGVLGAGLTGCAVSAAPVVGAAGAVRWTMTGTLAPGGSGSVVFRVRVL